jgi:AcrR family transcriptional regulator
MARDTRQALIDAARAELLEKGWHGTSGEGIRLRAKASKGSWAYHFPKGKQEVAVALYPKLRADLWTRWIDSLEEPGSKADIRRAFDGLIRAATSNPPEWRLLFGLEDTLPWLGDSDFLAESQKAAAYDRNAIARAWAAVPKGTKRSEGLAAGDPAIFYLLVMTPIRQALRQWLFGPNGELSDTLLSAIGRHAEAASVAVWAPKREPGQRSGKIQQSEPGLFAEARDWVGQRGPALR